MHKYLILLAFAIATPAFARAGDQPEPQNWSAFIYTAAKLLPKIVVRSGLPIPVHGNYCGPNHGDGNYWVEPIDAIDEACRQHDMCYDRQVGGTYLSCGCDAQFVDNLVRALANASHLSWEAMGKGIFIAGWFSKSECVCKIPSGELYRLENPAFGEKNYCSA